MGTTAGKTTGRATLKTPSDREIRTERVFGASRERVWRAFTDPKLVAQWWNRGRPLIVERMEPKRGGRWRYVDRPGGDPEGFEGRFREVKPQERIVQTFEWDGMPGHVSVTTTTFEDLGGGRTRVVTNLLFHTGEERDGMLSSGMELGLEESYAALETVLERAEES